MKSNQEEMVEVTMQPGLLRMFDKARFEAAFGSPYPANDSVPYRCLVFKKKAEFLNNSNN
jgi:hypothetical protein